MSNSQIANNGKPRNSYLFQKGQSGNPSGRPKTDATITALARDHTLEAISTLKEVMLNKRAPASARVHAASALLDRAWGKPAQYVESVRMKMTYQDWVINHTSEPTEDELKDIGLTVTALECLDDLAGL